MNAILLTIRNRGMSSIEHFSCTDMYLCNSDWPNNTFTYAIKLSRQSLVSGSEICNRICSLLHSNTNNNVRKAISYVCITLYKKLKTIYPIIYFAVRVS